MYEKTIRLQRKHEYDDKGKLIKLSEKKGENRVREKTFEYDNKGLCIKSVDIYKEDNGDNGSYEEITTINQYDDERSLKYKEVEECIRRNKEGKELYRTKREEEERIYNYDEKDKYGHDVYIQSNKHKDGSVEYKKAYKDENDIEYILFETCINKYGENYYWIKNDYDENNECILSINKDGELKEIKYDDYKNLIYKRDIKIYKEDIDGYEIKERKEHIYRRIYDYSKDIKEQQLIKEIEYIGNINEEGKPIGYTEIKENEYEYKEKEDNKVKTIKRKKIFDHTNKEKDTYKVHEVECEHIYDSIGKVLEYLESESRYIEDKEKAEKELRMEE